MREMKMKTKKTKTKKKNSACSPRDCMANGMDVLNEHFKKLKKGKPYANKNKYTIDMIGERDISFSDEMKPTVFAYASLGLVLIMFVKRASSFKVMKIIKFKNSQIFGTKTVGIYSKNLPATSKIKILHQKYWGKFNTQRVLNCIENGKDEG